MTTTHQRDLLTALAEKPGDAAIVAHGRRTFAHPDYPGVRFEMSN